MKDNYFKYLVFFLLVGITVNAQKYSRVDNSVITKSWNENTFSSSKSLIDNISEVTDFTLLKKALENKSIIKTIEAEEMITVFAITNSGFNKYKEKQDSIFSSSNEENLKAILTYHTIPGRVDSQSIKKAISKNEGIAYFSTLQGNKIGIKEDDNKLYLVDSNGNVSLISATDFYHKSGFFHIVNGIVYPFKN